MSEIEITQEDREAAAEHYEARLAKHGKSVWYGDMRDGNEDFCPLIQAFAAHRQAARERALEEAAEVADAERVGYVRDSADRAYNKALGHAASQIRKLKEG